MAHEQARSSSSLTACAPGATGSRRMSYRGGSTGLKRACKSLNVHPLGESTAARDPTQPANKKRDSVAERADAIVQDGARTRLMTAGQPAPYWAC
eukprot:333620-Pyramimonas_sp.AAC.1